MRTLRIYSLSNFQIYDIGFLTLVIMGALYPQYLSYEWKFVPFDGLHPIPPPTPPPASGNHKSDFFYSEFVFWIPNTSEIIWYSSFSVQLTILGIMPLGSIHVANDRISFFLMTEY